MAQQLTCKEELGTSLAQVNKNFSDARRDWRERESAAAEAKRREVADLHKQYSKQMEGPRLEVARMEDKVMRLQMQITEMAEDVASSRSREEAARGDLMEAQREKLALQGNVNDLTARVQELEEQRVRVCGMVVVR